MSEPTFGNSRKIFTGRGEEFLQYYRDNPAGRLYVEYCRKRIARQLPLGRYAEILDAGAAIGYITLPLAADGHRLILYDRDESMLELARDHIGKNELTGNARIVQGEIENLHELEDNVFDLVVCLTTLELCEQVFQAVSELVRVCKPGGKLLCTGANYLAKLQSAISRGDNETAGKILDDGIYEAEEGGNRYMVRAFRADELWVLFSSAGAEVEWIKGNRILLRLLGEDGLNRLISSQGLDACLDMELKLTEDPAIAGSGEDYCLLAVKK